MTFKDQCIALRKQDYSLGEIVRITGRPKTSVYAHIHSIPLSHKKWDSIRAKSGAHIRRFSIARKGKSERPFKKLRQWDKNTVFIASHILFDGDFGTGGFSYNNRSQVLIRSVERCVRSIYAFEPRRYSNLDTGVKRISYFNVALRAHVLETSEALLNDAEFLSKELKRVFIRSFFDDEGCIYFRPAKGMRRIRGYQKNIRILKIVGRLLLDFKIKSRIELPNEIVIVGQENLEKFQKEIGFSPGVRINGKRSNSIWKQSLEKREILRRALESYKPAGSPGVHRKV